MVNVRGNIVRVRPGDNRITASRGKSLAVCSAGWLLEFTNGMARDL